MDYVTQPYELELDQLDHVGGGGAITRGVVGSLLGGVGGAAAGRIIGTAFGAAWGGPAGFVLGLAVGIGYTLATSGSSSSRQYANIQISS